MHGAGSNLVVEKPCLVGMQEQAGDEVAQHRLSEREAMSRLITVKVPGGGELGLYRPRHAAGISLGD